MNTDGLLKIQLKDACEAVDYGYTCSASADRVGPHFLRITDIVSSAIDWRNVPFVAVDTSTLSKYRLFDGDIVLARTGASTGASAFVQNPPEAVFASYLVRLRIKKRFDARYVSYCLRSPAFQAYIHGVVGDKSAQPNASATTMTAAPMFVLEHIAEQRAVSGFLGALDDKIELNRKMSATLEAMARALFKSWFVDFDPVRAKTEGRDIRLPPEIAGLFPDSFENSELAEIPRGWRVQSIGDTITRLGVGKKYEQKTVASVGKVPVLDQGKTGVIGYHSDEPGVIATQDNPVIVFANHTCYMRLIDFPFSAIQNVLPFVGKNVETIWVYYATLGKQGFVEYKGHWPDFIRHKLVLPSKPLCTAFADMVKPMVARMSSAAAEIQTLAKLRDALLPKLISGEIRVSGVERTVEKYA